MDRRKKEDCCGCTACANICPVSAIEMKCDDEGFYYPHINSSLCIQCGRCDKICGFVPADKRFDSFSMLKAFGVKHLNESVRLDNMK